MWLTILKNWKYGLIAVLALTILIGGFYCKSLRRDVKDAESALEMANANFYQCQADQRIAKEVSSEYQTNLSALNSKLAKLRQSSKCIQISPGRPDATPTGGKLPRPNGISHGWLIDFSGRCEQTRLQLIGLQNYVEKVCK